MRKHGPSVALALIAIVVLAPFLYMISVSLMGETELLRWPPALIPHSPTLANYVVAFETLPYGRVLINTALLAGCVMVGQVLTSAAAGYAFARMRFPGRNIAFSVSVAFPGTSSGRPVRTTRRTIESSTSASGRTWA